MKDLGEEAERFLKLVGCGLVCLGLAVGLGIGLAGHLLLSR